MPAQSPGFSFLTRASRWSFVGALLALAVAIAEARARWRETIAGPLIERASTDGSASPDADFDSLVYLVQTLHLGLLVQRGAGQHAPDNDAWQGLIERLLRSMAHPEDAA